MNLKCPSCDEEIKTRKVCSSCGYDMRVYGKAKNISAKLYNKGLIFVQNGCISQGINFLEKALEFNKRNVDARNLLGLSYMYLGKVGDALKQWIISVHIKKDDNMATEYIETAQKNKSKLAKYDEAIDLYNEALVFVKERNEDMAIIRLKKAIYLSENFLDGHKLLVLCYMMQRNYDKAMDAIDKANRIDSNNNELVSYYKALNPESTIVKQNVIDDKQKIQKIYMKPRNPASVNKKKLAISLSMLFGAVSVAVIFAIVVSNLVFSGELNKLREENKQLVAKKTESESQKNQIVEERDDYKNKLEMAMQNQSSINQIKFLEQANEFYKNNNIEQAALKITMVDKTGLTQAELNTYQQIYDNTIPVVTKNYYNKGKSYYDAGKFDDARINFEKSLKYNEEQSFSSEALYYTALIYERENNKEKALEYINKIINVHKNSSKYEEAVNKKEQLGK